MSSDVVMSLSLVSVGDTREGALAGDTIDLHVYVHNVRTKIYTNSNVHNINQTQLALPQMASKSSMQLAVGKTCPPWLE